MSARLITLAGLRLIRNDHEVALPVQRRARAALLVYLAVERDVSRGQVMSVFWPESSEERARHALSQALYELRQRLGEEWLLVQGDRIRVLGTLQIDAEEFERAVEANSDDAALRLYLAPFLAGVDNLPASKPFENWADARRAHYERLHRRACRAQIGSCLARGDTGAAIAAAREWLRLDPQQDEAQHKLIELLAASGQRTEAVQQYEVYERQLAVDDLEPLDETRTLIAGIRARASGGSTPPHLPAAADPAAAMANESGEGSLTAPDSGGRARLRARALPHVLAFSAFAALVVTGWFVASGNEPQETSLDADRILILPFRAVGMEATVAAIGDGVVDLLSAKLDGTTGLHAVDAHTTFAALRKWQKPATELPRDSALLFARRLGAGMLLSGSVVATPGSVTISADLIDVARARVRSRASVEGDLDSLTVLLDRLTTHVIGAELGESDESLANFTSTSPAAVHEYLRGRYAYTRSGFVAALAHFDRAMQLDSQFALAALHYVRADQYAHGAPESASRARRVACAARHRVGASEQLRLVAFARCPDVVHGVRDLLDLMERAAAAASGDPELWGILGDALFHAGRGLPNWEHRAMTAFERALAFDVPYPAEPLAHLIMLKANNRDTAAVRLLSNRLVTEDTAAYWGVEAIWLPAALRGDTATLQRLRRSRFAELIVANPGNLYTMATHAQNLGIRIEDAELAVRIMKERADSMGNGNAGHLAIALSSAATLDSNAGRPSRARNANVLSFRRTARSDLARAAHVFRALYWDGDPAIAEAMVPELTRFVRTPPGEDATAEEFMKPIAHCALGLWFLEHGDTLRAEAHISSLPVPSLDVPEPNGVCRETLSTMLAFLRNAPDRITQLERLDSLLQMNPSLTAYASRPRQLIAARLFERSGRPDRALAAVRRTPYENAIMLSSFRREQGRLAVLTGDTTGAIRAYRHYLALRYDPEPHLRPEVERIRGELARLERKRPR